MLNQKQLERVWYNREIAADAVHGISSLADPATILERLEERTMNEASDLGTPQYKQRLNEHFELFMKTL